MTADQRERSAEIDRGTDRRHGGRGGRRHADRGRPWWQKGLFFGAVLAILRWGSSLPTVAEATRPGLGFVMSTSPIQVQAFLHFLNRIEGYADADGGASPKSLVLQCT
jgi:hypothetical protein